MSELKSGFTNKFETGKREKRYAYIVCVFFLATTTKQTKTFHEVSHLMAL